VPMINSREEAQRLVEYGKFPPLGCRGFNLRSRGLHYGVNGSAPTADAFEAANRRTHLFAQIETPEAVQNVHDICTIEGLSGVLIGPGDLSSSYGRPGDFTNPQLLRDTAMCIRTARSCGKHAGIVAGPGPLLDLALEAGCDLAFIGSDMAALATAWADLLESVEVNAAASSPQRVLR
jgi:4-hydroxy-2-oxoheptanedioate aldolase